MKKIIRLTESDLTRIVRRVLKEGEDMGIEIPKVFRAVRMELGDNASPKDIIDMYNEVIGSNYEGTPLVDYQNNVFHNEDGNEIPVHIVLDELNYGLIGYEDDYGDDEEF